MMSAISGTSGHTARSPTNHIRSDMDPDVDMDGDARSTSVYSDERGARERERERDRDRGRDRDRELEREREYRPHHSQTHSRNSQSQSQEPDDRTEADYEAERQRFVRDMSNHVEIDADDPYFLEMGRERAAAAWRASVADGIGPDRRIRPASRRNVSRACEQCRSRKSKCSGEMPCALCGRLGKECIYSTVADGRLTDRTAKRKIERLQDQVVALERELAEALERAGAAVRAAEEARNAAPANGESAAESGERDRDRAGGSVSGASAGGGTAMNGRDEFAREPEREPYAHHAHGYGARPLVHASRSHSAHPSVSGAASGKFPAAGGAARSRSQSYEYEYDQAEPQAPFGTGRWVLAPTGGLHLYPAATFYFPAPAPEWRAGLDALAPGAPGHPSRPARRGFLAPYLPFPLDPVHHALLLDASFAHLFSFGRNAFRDKFEAEMDADPSGKGHYFSPVFHLAALAIGWRYTTDERVTRTYYVEENVARRGAAFIDKALELMMAEVADPRLSTVLGLIALSEYHTGMLKESTGRSLFSMAMCLTQDLRLHRRCDGQLAELGLAVDCELDAARRDVYGSALNLSAWYAAFTGQDPVPLREHADQRLPLIRTDVLAHERDASEMFHHHVRLSEFGLQALHLNHTLRAPLSARVARVQQVWEGILAWRDSLPPRLRWPPEREVMHPSVVTTHGMAATYVILLFRPYLLEMEHSRIHDLALRACCAAAAEIIAQSRYLGAVGGVTSAPMIWQQILYVCGSMLILQATGLPTIPEHERVRALVDVDYIQAALDEIVHVWPIGGHTRRSLRELLAAATTR